MGDKKSYIINQIAKYSQKLDTKGFGANHDGNISALCDGGILATPTSVSKGEVIADIVITLDMSGNKVAGIGKPFSEILLHLAAYKARTDIKAVVHAHPPFATARGLVGKTLFPMLPEAVVSIGNEIPVVPFAMPGAAENNEIIADAVGKYDVFMLSCNGVFSVGNCVEQAYLRLELIEHLAKIYYYAEQMGNPLQLSESNLNDLLAKRAQIFGKREIAKKVDTYNNDELNFIKKIVAEELKKQ